MLQMEEEKVEQIKEAEVLQEKRQVRAFLGLAGNYRKFIPVFAEIVARLTGFTEKGQPNLVKWSDAHIGAFKSLKDQLTRAPILRL